MPQAEVAMEVREAAPGVRVIDIDGEVTAFSEGVLMDAFAEASGNGVRAVILNFEGLQYMNSGGIGLLVTVLIRATVPDSSCSHSASTSTTARFFR